MCARIFSFRCVAFFVELSFGKQNNIIGVEVKRGGWGDDTMDMDIFGLILVCPHNLNEAVVIGNEMNGKEQRESTRREIKKKIAT